MFCFAAVKLFKMRERIQAGKRSSNYGRSGSRIESNHKSNEEDVKKRFIRQMSSISNGVVSKGGKKKSRYFANKER